MVSVTGAAGIAGILGIDTMTVGASATALYGAAGTVLLDWSRTGVPVMPLAFDAYRQSLARGFHGPLNWYRNFERNWHETAPFAGQPVTPPTLFLVGDNDPVARLEAHTLKRMADIVPRLEQHRLPNCGHWLQGEQPQRVNALLLDFLARHYPA